MRAWSSVLGILAVSFASGFVLEGAASTAERHTIGDTVVVFSREPLFGDTIRVREEHAIRRVLDGQQRHPPRRHGWGVPHPRPIFARLSADGHWADMIFTPRRVAEQEDRICANLLPDCASRLHETSHCRVSVPDSRTQRRRYHGIPESEGRM